MTSCPLASQEKFLHIHFQDKPLLTLLQIGAVELGPITDTSLGSTLIVLNDLLPPLFK